MLEMENSNPDLTLEQQVQFAISVKFIAEFGTKPARSSGTTTCPHCGGEMTWSTTKRNVYFNCIKPGCFTAHSRGGVSKPERKLPAQRQENIFQESGVLMNGKPVASADKAVEKTPSWLIKARQSFCNGTPFSSPDQVVEAGLKDITVWTETLEQHRVGVREGFTFKRSIENNLTRDTKPEVSKSTVRRQILNVIGLHCDVSDRGLTAREVGERLGRTGNSIYQYLVDLVDDGVLVRQKPSASMPSNTVLYRVVGEGEVKS
jgi:hypothetical protein